MVTLYGAFERLDVRMQMWLTHSVRNLDVDVLWEVDHMHLSAAAAAYSVVAASGVATNKESCLRC